MRINRKWSGISLILLALPLIFAESTKADGNGDRKETKYRWELLKSPTHPVTATPAVSLRRWRMMDQDYCHRTRHIPAAGT